MRPTVRGLAFAALLLVASATVQAQLFRTYLAADGLDTNPCTLPQPCRLLPAALAAVASGGEIWMLDSANYNTGPVNVTKSVTIIAVPGVLGSVVTLGGPAIVVGTGSIKVTLRNINISSFPGHANQNGIDVTGPGATVNLDECRIRNVKFALSVTSTARAIVSGTRFENNATAVSISNGGTGAITDSTIANNSYGVSVTGSTGPSDSRVTLVRTLVTASVNYGLEVVSLDASATARAFVQDSQIVNNSLGALAATAMDAGPASIHFHNSTIAGNGTAIEAAGATALIDLHSTSLVHNVAPYAASGGVINTSGNNAIRSNGAPIGSLTSVGTQ